MPITQTSRQYSQPNARKRPHRSDRKIQHRGLSERAIVMCERLAETLGTSYPTQVSQLRGRRESASRA